MRRPAVSFATRKPVVATSLPCNALHPVAPLYGPCSKRRDRMERVITLSLRQAASRPLVAHAPKCS
jgi:hypothetical protein